MAITPPALNLSGVLQLYRIPKEFNPDASAENTYQLPVFISGSQNADKALVFVGGLFDGMGSVPYVTKLDQLLTSLGWTLLARDAKELEACVKHLREQGKSTIVLMGHSTGCQDLMTYLLTCHSSTQIQGAILQAPVSDREAFVGEGFDAAREAAEALIKEGKPDAVLPDNLVKNVLGTKYGTAYRISSLLSKGGDDDFFSTDLPPKPDGSSQRALSETFVKLPSSIPIACVFSGSDEYTPSHVDKQALFATWKGAADAAASGIQLEGHVVDGASHNVRQTQRQDQLMKIVEGVLETVSTKPQSSL